MAIGKAALLLSAMSSYCFNALLANWSMAKVRHALLGWDPIRLQTSTIFFSNYTAYSGLRCGRR